MALWSGFAPARLSSQESVSALPPPVTRSLYRSHWFEFLNAYLEDDSRGAAAALAEMKKAGRAVGVHRLSDFSRTAAHEARKAEVLGRPDRAARGYAAAFELDDANYAGVISRIRFLVNRRAYGEALRLVPAAAAALLATHESRLALFSSLAVWGVCAIGLAVLGSIVVLVVLNFPRIAHDVREAGERFAGPGAVIPLTLILLAIPLAFGLGPVWLLLYWAVLVYAYTRRAERVVLTLGLLLLGLLAPFSELVSRKNIVERSPLYVAAVDLAEKREDASAEDGLRQASAVFAEDPDVWFLLGMYAERAGDLERAQASYDRAIQADSKDYRPLLNRGNVHFQEGDFGEAVRDYDSASKRAPDAPEIYYNLAIARGELYDFEGQSAAMSRARQLSEKDVTFWSDHPTLARAVSAPYPVARARRKVEQWNAQSKSRRLPGHAPPYRAVQLLLSPYTLAPWGALLLAAGLAAWRSRRPLASQCVRCGAPFCGYCKRYGEPPLYCALCVRLHIRKEPLGIQEHMAQAAEIRRRIRQRDATCRLASLFFPGSHRFFSERPASGFVVLALFFFSLAAGRIGLALFDPRQLPPPGSSRLLPALACAAALVIWLGSLFYAWRDSHGS